MRNLILIIALIATVGMSAQKKPTCYKSIVQVKEVSDDVARVEIPGGEYFKTAFIDLEVKKEYLITFVVIKEGHPKTINVLSCEKTLGQHQGDMNRSVDVVREKFNVIDYK